MPSLQHLILDGVQAAPSRPPTKFTYMAKMFPNIERLTCQVFDQAVDDIFRNIMVDTETNRQVEGEQTPAIVWPKLRTIAISEVSESSDWGMLIYLIEELRDAGCPLPKLLLPSDCFEVGYEDSEADLKKLVEIGEFTHDWPKPIQLVL